MPNPGSMDFSHQVPPNGTVSDGTNIQYMSSVVYVTADRTLKVFEQAVHVDGASITVTLPPVQEAVGRTYIISNTGINTIADNDDSSGWGDITTAAQETWGLISNGEHWCVLKGA